MEMQSQAEWGIAKIGSKDWTSKVLNIPGKEDTGLMADPSAPAASICIP